MSERVCCLYRVSTAKQVDHNENNQADIPMQRKACKEFADKMGWEIVREEHEAGVSGYKVSASSRDKIQTIKAEAEKGKFDILLVFMFDRLGRKADETPFVVEWFSRHNIRVWSVKEGEQRFDSHTDHLTNYIRFWQADGESQKTSMRTKTALAQMVQEGRFRGGVAPFGYRLENSGILNKRKHEVKKLVIDEDEANIVRMIFSLSAGSGFGRFKICTTLNEQGIRNRKGENWHEATIGTILHNITYTGVLRSGETKSEIFPELQIIDTKTFEVVQNLMLQRKNECNEKRFLPRNTKGQSLLSGNIFCANCGGRLTLTTSGTVRKNADGTEIGTKRIRYVCYNKTRKRKECNGQTGYTMHILDGIIIEILHKIFDKMSKIREEDVISRTQISVSKSIKERIAQAKSDCTSITKEYESLKAEVVKSLSGKSAFPPEILSELVDSARQKMLSANEKLTELYRVETLSDEKIQVAINDRNRLLEWSKIFDDSEQAVKKMIAGYIIKAVHVRTGYGLDIEFNINMEQFELGLEV